MVKLPEGWERRRLGDVSSVIMGQSPSSSLINKEGKGLPFLQGNAEFTSKYPNPINWIEKPLKTASKGSILVSVRAPIGDLNFANSQCCIGRGLASIEANGFIVDNNFLWYSMHYFINELIKIGQGSTFEAIGRNELRNLCISLPPLPEQRKIAEILETADKAIEKTDAIIEKYRRIKQGLMRDLLTKGIDEKGQIRSEETHKFKDSPLGRLPEEWEVVRLGEIISVYDKKRIPLDSEFRLTIKGNIPYCGATGVIDYINDYIFDGEYLLIAEDGGNFGRFEETAYMMKGKFWANNHVHILRGRDGMSDNNFLMYFINFQDISCYISGSTREKLNQALLKSIIIPLPPLPEQHRIASVLSQIDEVIEKEERYKEKLERIKQGLMQDLLTGEVRVNHLIKET
jgi:type I restriction enzyme S subunit